MATTTPMPAGWYTDPARRHEYRYWNSSTWTDDISDRGVTGVDPLASQPAGLAATTAAPVPAQQQVTAPPQIDTREIIVPEGRLYYAGQMILLLGMFCYVMIATVGWGLGLLSGGSPGIYLASRSGALGTEYYVPGLLIAVLPWLVVAFQPRMDRKLKARRSREDINAQLDLGFSWRFTTSYVAKSYGWRRIVSVIAGSIAVLAAIAAAAAASSDGFTLAPAAFMLIIGGAVGLLGIVIELVTPYRRVRVDADGRVLDARVPGSRGARP